MSEEAFDGRCTCGEIQYRMTDMPLVVNCCSCSWCQRETGSAFVINAMIESDRVELLSGKPELVDTPSASGKGQRIARCPTCKVAVWGHYAGGGDKLAFVRVGTLEDPARFPPDVYVFASTKLPWVSFPEGARVYDEYYKRDDVWSEKSVARIKALFAK